jgi:hypothetical protein
MTTSEQTRCRDVFAQALDAFVVFFGSWTLYVHLLVYLGADFNTLLRFCLVPAAVGVAILYVLLRSGAPLPARELRIQSHEPRVAWPFKLLGALAIVGVYAWTENYLLFWITSVVFLVVVLLDGSRAGRPGGRARQAEVTYAFEKWGVGAFIIVAVAVTLIAHRPDHDDAFYVSVAVSALDHPERPLMRYDGMYGEPRLPILGQFHRVRSYETFVALVSSVAGLAVPTLYYVVFPALFATLVVIAHWLALGQLGSGASLLGLAVVFVVLVSWGDEHRTFGNFSFVRLFQGKAVLVSVVIPAIVYYAARYAEQGCLRSWLRLALAQVAAIGFASSGIAVGPIAAGLVLLGAWSARPARAVVVSLGLLASFYPILLALVFLTTGRVSSAGAVIPAALSLSSAPLLEKVLGSGWHAYVALFSLLAAPALPARSRRCLVLPGLALTTMFFALSPMASEFLGRFVRSLSWRAFWGVPFPLIIGLAACGLATATEKFGRLTGIATATALAAAFALGPGSWTLSFENRTVLANPGYKVSPEYKVAEKAVALTPPGGLILAPWRVSSWIPLFRNHPRVVGVRRQYLSMVSEAFGERDARHRHKMVSFVERGVRSKKSLVKFMRQVQRRPLTTIVTSPRFLGQRLLSRELRSHGFTRSDLVGGYRFWVRKEASQE